MCANAIRKVEDECNVRTRVVVTDALPVEMRGSLMVLITGRELNFASQEVGKISRVEQITFEFYKTYWYRVLRVIFEIGDKQINIEHNYIKVSILLHVSNLLGHNQTEF